MLPEWGGNRPALWCMDVPPVPFTSVHKDTLPNKPPPPPQALSDNFAASILNHFLETHSAECSARAKRGQRQERFCTAACTRCAKKTKAASGFYTGCRLKLNYVQGRPACYGVFRYPLLSTDQFVPAFGVTLNLTCCSLL